MRRSLAILLAAALVAAPAAVASLHVHSYAEHDHPEHHHGPASHEHGPGGHDIASASDDHERAESPGRQIPRLEACEPGGHVVAIKLAGARAPQVHVSLAEAVASAVALPAVSVRATVIFTDVRVHGPPFDPRVPARAPPLTPLA